MRRDVEMNNVASKILLQWWPNIMIMESKQTIVYITFIYISLLSCSHCYWFDQKTGTAFNGSFNFTLD